MVEWPEDLLRKHPLGTWKYMLPQEEPDWGKSSPNDTPVTQARWLGKGRVGLNDVSWRVSTRKELVEYHGHVMKSTYKKLALALLSLIVTLYSFSMYASTHDLTFAFFALVFVALMSRFYTSAWGGYAGGWSDYEHDPVQMVTQNSYVLTGNRLM